MKSKCKQIHNCLYKKDDRCLPIYQSKLLYKQAQWEIYIKVGYKSWCNAWYIHPFEKYINYWNHFPNFQNMFQQFIIQLNLNQRWVSVLIAYIPHNFSLITLPFWWFTHLLSPFLFKHMISECSEYKYQLSTKEISIEIKNLDLFFTFRYTKQKILIFWMQENN